MASKPKHSRNGSASPETHRNKFFRKGATQVMPLVLLIMPPGNRTLLTVEGMNKTSHKQPQARHYTKNRANLYLVIRSLEVADCLCPATSSRKSDLGFRELGLVSQVCDRQGKDSLAITRFEVNSNHSETVISTQRIMPTEGRKFSDTLVTKEWITKVEILANLRQYLSQLLVLDSTASL
ncbi:hypothetical protein VNO77_37583 [Canavalia gladiata]|uniref:Uncharacterized protein n=1 Tax=Canavalia gladiata TaxID=3824 RepID=A0AAN9K8Z8_CANGL